MLTTSKCQGLTARFAPEEAAAKLRADEQEDPMRRRLEGS